jgi:hypothetical protein
MQIVAAPRYFADFDDTRFRHLHQPFPGDPPAVTSPAKNSRTS